MTWLQARLYSQKEGTTRHRIMKSLLPPFPAQTRGQTDGKLFKNPFIFTGFSLLFRSVVPDFFLTPISVGQQVLCDSVEMKTHPG